MDRTGLTDWIERYEQLWRTEGTDGLSQLFTADATYRSSPWDEPVRGLDALGAFWEAEREGAEESFTMQAEIVALDGDVGVVRVQVAYEGGQTWRDLWIIQLDADGRCPSFEEWPFAPAGADGAFDAG